MIPPQFSVVQHSYHSAFGNQNCNAVAASGIALLAPFGSVDEKFFNLQFNANVKGFFFSVQKGLPVMNDGGSIIMNASIAATKGFPGMSVYNAPKAALRSFARTWTNDLRERRIRVNAISPGHVFPGLEYRSLA